MKVSISVALEKLTKIYSSCKTTKHYIIANRYRKLFINLYHQEIKLDRNYYIEITNLLSDLETNTIERLLTHYKTIKE